MADVKTIEITNFSGRLTRIINGDLNSGFARFTTSFGYDPFSKPMNLTWLETPTSVAGLSNNLPLTAKVTADTTQGPNVHMIDQGGKWYQIRSATTSNSNLDSVVAITSLVSTTFNYGASMEFFGSVAGADISGITLPKLYFGGDDRVSSINPNGSGEATIGAVANYANPLYRPLKQFVGTLIFGNGPTIGQINNTGTVNSSVLNVGTGNIYSALNPALGAMARVQDLEVSISNDYITIATANAAASENLNALNTDFNQTFSSQEGKLFLWNGIDTSITAATSTPTYFISALKTYFKNTAFFATDTFGTTFNTNTGFLTGLGKILSLPSNRSPLPNAVTTNGNFVTWACPEVDSTKRYMSLYYFGSLDQENPPGLYRLLRWTSAQSSGFIDKVPLNILVSNVYKTVNSAGAALVTFGYGKHYIGLSSRNSTATQNYLLSFLVTSTGSGTPQTGVYETQTQLFSKRIRVSQIRFYIEPSASGNAFTLDMIGSDGTIIANGTYKYTHGDLTDPLSGSSAVERINFNPNARTQFALGLRITNTGTVNMTIKKIEVDYVEEGK